MLLELRIGNLALAEDLVLRPGAGLTVLTGETGAGKSLIAGAIALLTGGKAERGLIRRGEDLAFVEAVCDLDAREDLRAEVARLGLRLGDDGLLVLRRELRREGRGRVLVNGMLASVAVLEELGRRFFAIQSQHQQQELATGEFARELLDAVLGLRQQREMVAQALADFRSAQQDLAGREREVAAASEQLEMWRYQHGELVAAALRPLEEEELAESLAVKRHSRALQEAASLACDRLATGAAPAREALGAAIAALQPHAERSTRLASALDQLRAAAELTADAATELGRFLDGFQIDPRSLDELEERKALYEDLRRKYRCDVDSLIALRDKLAERLGRQDLAAEDLARLRDAYEAQRLRLTAACRDLHDVRARGAARVSAAAEDLIRPLAMPQLDLTVTVDLRRDPDGPITIAGEPCSVAPHGANDVRILVRTNPGENQGEVGAIASGGESSRIYLGLLMLRRADRRPLLRVFDEVDAGLGMDAATPVARLLRELARDAQALCVTHLPTVTVYGQDHWRVAKSVHGGRTTVDLERLEGEKRVAEIARQLGGEGWRRGDAAAQTTYARELLAAADGAPAPAARRTARARGNS
ncbi:MAG TPA: AAA family ATPase [Candidatus Krumholzibacteria bacterium]|nr:AAA family ATPase [Candidatus Krumholzibacteria bacterium]HPD71524.1 AAA family ATPase [Candidatus Krumholzibacteria bacterium]HRY41543.1 AAA family ATPase [Candidatus Krumholzibacteria bacterium]